MNVDIGAVRRAKEGNAESFELVYAQVAPDLFRMAVYLLGNAHDAEDAVSETFLEAYKGIKNLRDENSFRPWIMKILSIRCKQKIKGYIKEKNTVDVDEVLNLASKDMDMSAAAEVTSALASLSTDERMIVILSVVQGYTSKEIASILSCPQGTVSSKLHRSLRKMRGMLS